ncbi:MAG: hypothetical protein M3Z98_07015 [Candidatus Dormibacteraeota bacterium]|nr:hypothetical protein [Candidatus Dormibacteraeota bacterium]
MDLRRVQDAAKELGVGEATIWRWLSSGLLKRYKSKPGAPRATFVDLIQVRKLRERPPIIPVRRTEGNQS